MSKDMSYRVGKYQQFKYVTAKWVIPPNKIITTQLEDYLQSSGLFSSVLSMQSYIRSDLVLETDVEDFLQYFSKDKKSSYVILKVKLTLIDLHSNRILESKKFQIKKDVKELSANGGVVAFEQALREFLMQSGLWLSGVCQ
ncbi:hypothetical protein MNB_SM-3-227 [hydrothermal vent metagenome]|uniref:Uncharacterized protein n=1 Tax=hydrothermal vent metagenome TaxID=652676 RepID=A0A1W1D330_9ZZZZ